LLSALLVVLFSLALSFLVTRETLALRALPDLSLRQTQAFVGLAYVTFVGVIGFIAYWRYITFHSEVCDASYEVNAVAGIVRHGLPTLSVAAFFYDGQPLPGVYFNNHVPFADYLFAPFFLVYRYPSSVVWGQAAVMGAGAFGAYLIGRKWLESRMGGVLAAWLYVDYVRRQAWLFPRTTALVRYLAGQSVPATLRADWAERQAPLVRACAWIAQNIRFALLAVTAVPGWPAAYCWIVLGPLNLVLVALILAHERRAAAELPVHAQLA